MKTSLAITLFFCLLSSTLKSQTNYSLGLIVGCGANVYRNERETDRRHFDFNNTASLYIGAKLIKNLDDKNNLFAELTYGRKKIELEYRVNESELPYESTDISGQKYASTSLFFGYRRQIVISGIYTYAEASVGADYNSNNVSYVRGKSGLTEDIPEPVLYQNFSYTNLGEKTFTISSNVGFGLNFGSKNQFDIGVQINIPFQSIQSNESTFDYNLQYQGKEYNHKINYTGKIYYPSLKLTYYFF